MSLLDLNQTTNLDSYNCGGFALGTFDWYCPYVWRNGQYDWAQMFEECCEEMTDNFDLTPIRDPSTVPVDKKVIGFRFAIDEDADEDADVDDVVIDFHFILREDGVWYHKPGSNRICILPESEIYDPWPRPSLSYGYNTEIAWFIKD